jgi:N-acetylmuramoyl-L-alanine amidase
MRISKTGKIKDVNIQTARKISDILNQDGYITEIIRTDIGDGYEIVVYKENKRSKRWWCYLA